MPSVPCKWPWSPKQMTMTKKKTRRRCTSMRVIDQSARAITPQTMEQGVAMLRNCEYAGRQCYNSFDRMTDTSYEPFLKSLIRRGHTSVLEHEKVTLEIVTGRDVLAEITRHRLASFSVQSQRYVRYDKEGGLPFIRPEFYIPNGGDLLDAKRYCASRAWETTNEFIEKRYRYLLDECGLPPEDARKILPNSMATQLVMTVNLRELLHIIRLRASPRAYPEMRTLMARVIETLTQVMPPIWEWDKEDAQ